MSLAQHIIVSTSEHGDINMIPTAIAEGSNTSALEARQNFGTLKWVISEHGKFRLWRATYDIRHPVTLQIKTGSQYFGFFFALKNDLQYKVQGLDSVRVMELQYDMFFVPNLQIECQLDPQSYLACGLNFKPSFFKSWHRVFKPLNDLLTSVEFGDSSRIHHAPLGITPRVSATLFNILHCNYTGEVRKKYLDIKVTELAFHIFQEVVSSGTEPTNKQDDLSRIQAIHSYLMENLSAPGTIGQLAHRFGFNDFKLKKSFKQVYNTSIYAFIMEERMQQALIKIIETDLPIAEIAHISGYSSISAFSTAFKNKFGYPPSTLRKGR